MQIRPTMRILSEPQKAAIHESVIRLLSKTGVAVQDPRALQIYADAGATVDGERVRISGELLEKCVERAPLFDRSMKGQGRNSNDMAARLRERTRQLMLNHRPQPISDQADKELSGLELRLRNEPMGV